MLIQLLRKDACEKRPFYFFIYPPPINTNQSPFPFFPYVQYPTWLSIFATKFEGI